MEIVVNLNAPSFSINKAYYKNRKRTRECRIWGMDIHNQIMNNESLIADLSRFREKVESAIESTAIGVDITYYIPEKLLYTTKGKISRRSKDLSNVEKLLIDLIFDKRYFERDDIPTLCLDDTLITDLTSRKRVSWDNNPHITIRISCYNSLITRSN